MKNVTFLFLCVTIATLLTTKAEAQEWQRVLTCDGGAAYLEVATYERRFLQLVITNPKITQYLAANSFMKPVFNNPNILLISGATQRGVFSSGDFSSMGQNQDNLGYVYTAQVDRR